MKKKKIFFLIESFIVGGAEKVLIDVANNLDARKYDITVISVFKHSVYAGYNKKFDYSFDSHVHFRSLINNYNIILYTLFNFLLQRVPNLLFHLLIPKHFDVAVAFYEGLPTYWIGQSRIKRCKKIAWLHTSTNLSQKNKGKEELSKEAINYKAFHHIVAVSRDVSKSFSSTFSQLSPPLIAYNPVDSKKILSKAEQSLDTQSSGEPILVTVGRLTEAKGYKRWLEIVKHLTDKGYQFKVWIVGGGNDEELKTFVLENKLTSVVTFWGHQNNPYPFIKRADWVVCTSFYEGLSTVILESIILKKAILTTECPGMRELLGDNEFGVVVANNAAALQKGVENILSNNSLKEYYEKKVSSHPKKFEMSIAIKHIESLLDD